MNRMQVILVAMLMAVLGIGHVTARNLPYSSRLKRISSDQRMAELQALLAMAYRPAAVVGHGAVDTYNAGKKKRSYVDETPSNVGLDDILQRMQQYLDDRYSL